jgi:predicted ATPase/class 3 adenylate cyclase
MARSRDDLPTGTVTFMFSDIEGSTELTRELDTATFRALLEQHHAIVRQAYRAHGGVERGTQGDSFLVIFRDAPSAVAAATDVQRALAVADWPGGADVRVRIGLHSGEGIRGADDYVGLDVNRAARIASAAHGGEVLVSDSTRALAGRGLPAGVELRDLGQHRLKDLDEAERLHRLVIEGLPDDFPPPRARPERAGNLPARVTSFLGRGADLEAVRGHLGDRRLVTLVGPGGTGKTALATEVARQAAADFDDGAWFVGLDGVSEPADVDSAIVAGLGLRDTSGRPAADRLADNLSGRHLLLVLDNFEHVLAAVPLVGRLLVAAPALRVLVTSRAPLHLAGEQVYPVAPLALPTGRLDDGNAGLEASPAVQLFVDRAQRVQPTFALTPENVGPIVEVCRALDGLPLGIELAAARVGLLGVTGLRERLARHLILPGLATRDAPPRQQTLTGAVAWSHDLLDPLGRTLFARLSVFVGGCRLAEAEAVCGFGSLAPDKVVDGLAALADQSLVTTSDVRGAVRFGMLDTVRTFAREQLAEVELTDLQRRHAEAYRGLVDVAAGAFERRADMRALDRISEDWSNVRHAVAWAIEAGEHEIALGLVGPLWRFWWLRGEMQPGLATTAAALSMPGAEVPTARRMRALEALGGLRYYSGDGDGAAEAYDAQIELARQLGDVKGTADAMFNRGFTLDLARTDESRAFIDRVSDAYRAAGDETGVARTDWLRANMLMAAGRPNEARQAMEASVARFEELDDVAYVLLNAGALAMASLQTGDRQGAVRWFVLSLERNQERQDAAGIAVALPLMAAAALTLVGPEPAAIILGAYESMSRWYGIRMPYGLAQIVDLYDPWKAARTALGSVAFESALERGGAMSLTEATEFIIRTLKDGVASHSR